METILAQLCVDTAARWQVSTVVANQDSDRLTVLRVDHANGTLSEPIQHFEIGTPLSVKLAAYSTVP